MKDNDKKKTHQYRLPNLAGVYSVLGDFVPHATGHLHQ